MTTDNALADFIIYAVVRDGDIGQEKGGTQKVLVVELCSYSEELSYT